MDFSALLATLSRIKGATFATIDSTTFPVAGVMKVTKGANVILFNTERGGYEKMVKKRLLEIGRNPDDFAVGPLPWGRRLYGPVIQNDSGDKRYLQSVILNSGESSFFLRSGRGYDIPCLAEDLPNAVKRRLNQRLPIDKQVEVRTIDIDHIDTISLMGETFGFQEQVKQQAM